MLREIDDAEWGRCERECPIEPAGMFLCTTPGYAGYIWDKIRELARQYPVKMLTPSAPVVMAELDWTPTCVDQSVSRITGREPATIVLHTLYRDKIDEHIELTILKKREAGK